MTLKIEGGRGGGRGVFGVACVWVYVPPKTFLPNQGLSDFTHRPFPELSHLTLAPPPHLCNDSSSLILWGTSSLDWPRLARGLFLWHSAVMTVPALPADLLPRLVKEAALDYFPPEEIARQLGLDPSAIHRILAHPEVSAAVARTRRELTESGERFVLAAKQAATELIPEVLSIALNPEEDTSDRLNAAKFLSQWSGFAQPESAQNSISIQITGVDDILALRQANPWGASSTQSAGLNDEFVPLTIDLEADHAPAAG